MRRNSRERMKMLYSILFWIVILSPIIAVFGAIAWWIYTIVKMWRCHVWFEEHDEKIGSDYFFEWCDNNSVKPSYFL